MHLHSNPIIVTGMHRSGTTVLSRLLDLSGAFSGWLKDANNEAYFFIGLNEWILLQCGAAWDNPEPIDWLLQSERIADGIAAQLRRYLESPYGALFSGHRYLRGRNPSLGFPQAWGWKDPRNSVTLPIWLRLFPDARIVNLTRHGVDVAASLRARQSAFLQRTARHYPTGRSTAWPPLLRRRSVVSSVRCASLAGGLSLWSEYLDRVTLALKDVPGERQLTIRYEDLMLDPPAVLGHVLRFCGLDSPEDSREFDKMLSIERVDAWKKDDELRAFAVASREVIERHGYSC